MKVAFRVDASPELGSGHVVRCLALAEALAGLGDHCTFLCARVPQGLARQIEAAGHALARIPDPGWTLPDGNAGWPDAVQQADARETLDAARDPDWMVVDHYGLDHRWERAVRGSGAPCLAIDDLGRSHECDILLDQTVREGAAPYPPEAAPVQCLGPRFALLRSAFAAARTGASRRVGPVRRLFVMMGGSDPGYATGLALDALEGAGLGDLPTDVVTGSANPNLASLRDRMAGRSNWTLHVDSGEVPKLMASADLAIGAGGTATWERCAMGLPALALELAGNQRDLLAGAARLGLILHVPGTPDAGRLARHLEVMAESEGLRASLSARGMAMVDGEGARRVAAAMTAPGLTVRPARATDCEPIHGWRNATGVRVNARNPEPISLDTHRAWFTATLASTDQALLVGERDGADVGVVRFDRIGDRRAEVSIYLAPGARRGDGGPLLAAGEAWLRRTWPDIGVIVAETLPSNARSDAMFLRSGYRLTRHVLEKDVHS